MRHVSHTHRASVAWPHEQHARGNFEFDYVSTDGVAVDIITTSIHVPAKWLEARKRINVFGSVDEFQGVTSRARPKPQAFAVACLCSQFSDSSPAPPQSAGDRAVGTIACGTRPPMAQAPPQVHQKRLGAYKRMYEVREAIATCC